MGLDRNRLNRVLAVALLAGAGWWLGSRFGDRIAAPPAATRPAPIPATPQPTPVAPQVRDVSELRSALDDHAGRPLAILVWSPYAGSSAELAVAVDAATRGSAVAAIGVVSGGQQEWVEGICRQFGISWPQFTAPAGGGGWAQALGVTARAPQLVLIEDDGTVIRHGRPDRDAWAALRDLAGPRVEPTRPVTGRIVWNGRPLAELDAAAPRFWFRDETRSVEAELELAYSPEDSSVSLGEVPAGVYGVSVFVGHVSAEPEAAYKAWTVFAVPVAAAVPEVEIRLARALHLRSPVDNGVETGGSDALLVHSSPVHIRWDPLPGATVYTIDISRQPHSAELSGSREPLYSESLEGSELSIELEPGFIHQLMITAHADGHVIGRLWGRGSGWSSSSYRFLVGEPILESVD